MAIILWAGTCSRCGYTDVDAMDLFIAVGSKGITDVRMICKNAILCQQRQQGRTEDG